MKAYDSSKFLRFLVVCLAASVFSQAALAEFIAPERVLAIQTHANRSHNTDPHTKFFINKSVGSDGNDVWRTVQPFGNPGTDYFTNSGVAPTFIFDLGSDCELDSFDFYGIPYANRNSVSALTLDFATSAEGILGFSGNPIEFSGLALGSSKQANDLGSYDITARYVLVTLIDNHYLAGQGGGDRVGLARLYFNGTPGLAPTEVVYSPVTNAQYDFLITPDSVVEKNNDGTTAFTAPDRDLTSLITDNPTQAWRTNTIGNSGNDMTAAGNQSDYFTHGVSPILEFDLGKEYDLYGLTLSGTDGGADLVKEFSLAFYDSDMNLLHGGYDFALENLIDLGESVEFSFDELSDVQYVQMLLSDNFYGSGNGGSRVGFSGLSFHGMNDTQSTATPEPATWVMMILGLLGGAVVYRRRKK